ncbi:ArsR/SmtB family transcription factor [Entomohabitans teleogrylli]|uniref:ArsR/SmtB family transcription factor n=1 Tax=Entomohabitans teleogrylli TaxID=1384589 RepID=UPI00073D99FB|nr:helix-turn-helix domain-containing protein [Entomohabitans teleogrylli]
MTEEECLPERLARVAAAIADASRARMLNAMMDGRAWTATELSLAAGVSPSTASSHLARLTEQDLTHCVRQGKHRYYRIARHDVAHLLEMLMHVADRPSPALKTRTPDSLRFARTCYDHLAGSLGVALHNAILARGWLAEDTYQLTHEGERQFIRLGIDCQAAGSRPFACHCLDWSERRMHIGGQCGARLLALFIDKRWLTRIPDSRQLTLTSPGEKMLKRHFGLEHG